MSVIHICFLWRLRHFTHVNLFCCLGNVQIIDRVSVSEILNNYVPTVLMEGDEADMNSQPPNSTPPEDQQVNVNDPPAEPLTLASSPVSTTCPNGQANQDSAGPSNSTPATKRAKTYVSSFLYMIFIFHFEISVCSQLFLNCRTC